MLIFDGDYPMAYGALDLNRDLTVPIGEARAQPDKDSATLSPNAGIMATLPEILYCREVYRHVSKNVRPGRHHRQRMRDGGDRAVLGGSGDLEGGAKIDAVFRSVALACGKWKTISSLWIVHSNQDPILAGRGS